MRRPLTKTKRANPGDTVICSCRLATGAEMQRVSIWAAAPGYDLAPYVDFKGSEDFLREGRPIMRRPMFTTLSEHQTSHEFVISVDERMHFRAVQDIDTDADAKAHATLKVYSQRGLVFRNFIKGMLRKVFPKWKKLA